MTARRRGPRRRSCCLYGQRFVSQSPAFYSFKLSKPRQYEQSYPCPLSIRERRKRAAGPATNGRVVKSQSFHLQMHLMQTSLTESYCSRYKWGAFDCGGVLFNRIWQLEEAPAMAETNARVHLLCYCVLGHAGGSTLYVAAFKSDSQLSAALTLCSWQ
ncbi:hypothetical protein BV20DRAFT_859855 [Pilatotrama ljubarskyi]|nr:hypothetical protein BV20DRAFT_859855 [Pilatotrama ljubarskyi]